MIFTGVDGTRAFVTGEFNEAGLVDDIEGLDAEAIQSIEDWRLMYHKDYTLVGKTWLNVLIISVCNFANCFPEG